MNSRFPSWDRNVCFSLRTHHPRSGISLRVRAVCHYTSTHTRRKAKGYSVYDWKVHEIGPRPNAYSTIFSIGIYVPFKGSRYSEWVEMHTHFMIFFLSKFILYRFNFLRVEGRCIEEHLGIFSHGFITIMHFLYRSTWTLLFESCFAVTTMSSCFFIRLKKSNFFSKYISHITGLLTGKRANIWKRRFLPIFFF